MTPAELMAIDPAEMARMSDAELGEKLAPLMPLARAAFAGKTDKVVTLPSGAKTTRAELDRNAMALANMLKLQSNPNQTKPTQHGPRPQVLP